MDTKVVVVGPAGIRRGSSFRLSRTPKNGTKGYMVFVSNIMRLHGKVAQRDTRTPT